MNISTFKIKSGIPFLLLVVLLSIFYQRSNAQTFDIGINKYTFSTTIRAIAKDNAGNTYVGGGVSNVALWSGHGAQFNSTTGVQNTAMPKVAGGSIDAVVAIPSGGWYIGGTFTAVNGITRNRLARINADGTLHAFDPNMSDDVYALALDGSGNLYAGGGFTSVGGVTRNRLCKFDASGALATFDPNISSGLVFALAVNVSGNLYVGGFFTSVGGVTRNHLCQFDASGTLTAFDPNMGSTVRAFALDGSGNLYVGGQFGAVGGVTRNYLCQFDASGTLTAFDPNMGSTVRAIVLDGANLYAGGDFTTVGGVTRNYLCQFDASGTVTAFDPNMSDIVYALALDGSNLYAGGDFTTVGGVTRNRLCKLDASGTLTTFDPKINTTGPVRAIAFDGSNVYVGGGFTGTGTVTRNRLCKFDASGTLTEFDPNMSGGDVLALAVDGSGNLYAGGSTLTVGGVTRWRLCKFDASGTLTAFDPNMNSSVDALAVDGSGNLYAGGFFTTVGGVTRNRLCKFDASGTLTDFDPNMDNSLRALAVDGSGNLYAGGEFTSVGGVTRNRLCKFDASGTLTAFDPNMGSSVRALAVNGSGHLYVGGSFTTVGSVTRNRLCQFDASGTLTAFDPNMGNAVNALILDGSNLYAGGVFTTVGGVTRNRLCKFDNMGALTAFDPNMGNTVYALVLNGTKLYAGGLFNIPAYRLAIYRTVEPCTPSVSIVSDDTDNSITAGTSVTFTATPTNGGTTPAYQWKKNGNNVGTNSATYTDAALANGDKITCVLTSNAPCASPTTATSNEIAMTVCTNPTAYTVTGGGAYCAGGTGVVVGLANSQTGVTYQLKNSTGNVGAAVSGTGAAINFGNQTAGGIYTVEATRTIDGCTATMTGSVTVEIYALPTARISGNVTVCKDNSSPIITFTAITGKAPFIFTYKINGGANQTLSSNASSASVIQSTSTAGIYTYTLVSIEDANGCSQTQSGSASITVLTKPTISLTVQQTTLLEGGNQTLCALGANANNSSLGFNLTTACLAGNPVWRVQVGGTWSAWSSSAPSSQANDNQAHRYQAACDANCTNTYTDLITLTLNYRASTPQNVSLVADGVSVAAGESKEVCDVAGNTIAFNATCGTGERVLYSVDGGLYLPQLPTQIVDGQFHNYRVRCQKSDGTASCTETASDVMRLKISAIAAAPVASLNVTSGCGTSSSFSGTANCGSLTAVWYNATTNAALPTLPTTTPNETTSYYARCQNATGCQSEKSNVVTFTLTPVNEAPVVSVSSDLVCTGTEVTVSTTCPTGASALWNTGITESSFKVAFGNVTKQTYSVRCAFANGCQSPVSAPKSVTWKGFELTIINIGQSKSAIKTNDRAAWASQFVTPDGGPSLDRSTEANPTLYYSENANKTGPRYWTIHADACALGTGGSLTFDMLATPESGPVRSFNTHENNAPYFMYANRDGYTELYAQNHPAYGFYLDNGVGGNVYDEGLPKGLYKLGVRYWDQKGWGSIYPSTRKPQGNVLAYQEYWFRIQSKDGIGVGAARVASDNILSSRRDLNPLTFAEVMPNPVSNTLRLKVLDAKNQKVSVSLLDASGRTLLQRGFMPETNTHQEEFNVSEMANGMYFLKVSTADKQATLKVVKVQ